MPPNRITALARRVLTAALTAVSPKPAGLIPRAEAGESAAAAPEPAPATDRAMLDATKTTAWATWVGVLVAFVAVVISGFAWAAQRELNHEQQKLNRDQREINRYLLLRAQRVYASRVAIWAVHGREKASDFPAGLDVSIQNRAPVPLRSVTLHAPLEDNINPPAGSILIPDIRPCTLLTFRLSAPPPHNFRHEVNDWLSHSGLILEFSETDRRWRLGPNSLDLVIGSAERNASGLPLLIPRTPETEPLGDCSESG